MNAIDQKQKVAHRLIMRAPKAMINRNLKRNHTRSQQKAALRKEW